MDNILGTSTSLPSTPPTDIQYFAEVHMPHTEISEVENLPQLEVEPIVEEGKPPQTSS